VLSPQGGSRLLLKLGEFGLLSLWVGRSVLQEADEVVRRKTPHCLPLLALLLESSGTNVGPPPDAQALATAMAAVGYLPDATVLAEASAAQPDWFITLDRKHFLANPGVTGLPFRFGVPGDLLAHLRDQGKTGATT